MKNYLLVFIGFSTFITILSSYILPRWMHYLFKPVTTLLIIILAYLSPVSIFINIKYFVLLALTFSLFGDVFLMFKKENFFLPGLVSFLIAHIFYILAFYNLFHYLLFVTQSLVILAILLVYGGVVFFILKSRLGSMLVPVFIYMMVLLTMAWFAFGVGYYFSSILMASSLLFVASDTTLAFNRFYKPFHVAEVIILATYFASQTLFALYFYYIV